MGKLFPQEAHSKRIRKSVVEESPYEATKPWMFEVPDSIVAADALSAPDGSCLLMPAPPSLILLNAVAGSEYLFRGLGLVVVIHNSTVMLRVAS